LFTATDFYNTADEKTWLLPQKSDIEVLATRCDGTEKLHLKGKEAM
jgi:hypothetical protein